MNTIDNMQRGPMADMALNTIITICHKQILLLVNKGKNKDKPIKRIILENNDLRTAFSKIINQYDQSVTYSSIMNDDILKLTDVSQNDKNLLNHMYAQISNDIVYLATQLAQKKGKNVILCGEILYSTKSLFSGDLFIRIEREVVDTITKVIQSSNGLHDSM
jgi:hypothetical protein